MQNRKLLILVFIALFASCTTARRETSVRHTLDGSKSYDPDGVIVLYNWKVVNNKKAVIQSPNSVTTPIDIFEDSVIVRLTVTDNDGATDSDTIPVRKQK